MSARISIMDRPGLAFTDRRRSPDAMLFDPAAPRPPQRLGRENEGDVLLRPSDRSCSASTGSRYGVFSRCVPISRLIWA